MKSFIIERPETHHVIISDTTFTVEHPLECDLVKCSVMTLLWEAWPDKPAENGRYQINFLEGIPMLGEALDYRRYRVKPLKR